jgi:hypothetical protein
MAGGFLGICIYGLVLLIITAVSLFTTGWTKKTIIILVLAWIPFVLFMGAIILLMMSYFNGGNLARPLLICAIVILPLVLLGVLYYFIQRFIRHLRE